MDAARHALEGLGAVVREAARRALGMRHFDVQLIGGMVLHEGKIAEMRTGEGKTPSCALFMSSMGMLILAVCYWAVDIKGGRVGVEVDLLVERLEAVAEAQVAVEVEVPLQDVRHGVGELRPAAGALRSELYRLGNVLSERVDEQGNWWLEIALAQREIDKLLDQHAGICEFHAADSEDVVADAAQAS